MKKIANKTKGKVIKISDSFNANSLRFTLFPMDKIKTSPNTKNKLPILKEYFLGCSQSITKLPIKDI